MNSSGLATVTNASVTDRPQGQPKHLRAPNSGFTRQRRLLGVIVIAAVAMAAHGLPAQENTVEYTFGRPLKDGERTYDWYRKTHAEEAASRYGVDAKAVADGMD